MSALINFVYLTSIIATLSLGLLVFFQNPKHSINRLFSLFSLSILGWQISLYFFYTASDVDLVLFLGRLNFVFAQFIALSLFYFCSFFPTGQSFVNRKLLKLSTFLTIILSLITLFTPLIVLDEIITGPTSRNTIVGVLYFLFATQFLSLTFGGISVLIKKYFSFKGFYKQQTFFLLSGFIIGISFGTLTNIVFPTLFRYFGLQNFGLLAPLIFVSFASYAIIKHRLLDIRLLVARTISYTLLVAVIGGIFSFTLFFVGYFFLENTSTTHNLAISTIFALILSFAFQPLRKIIESTTDNFFYKGKYSSQDVLKKLNKYLISTYHVSDLINNTLNELMKHLKIKNGQIILTQKSKIYLQTHNDNAFTSELTSLEIEKIVSETHKTLLLFDEISESSAKEVMRKYGVRIVVPLITKNNFIGLILLGDKLSGDIYSDQDLKLLELFSPELSLAVQNAEAYENISQFNITLREEVDSATASLKKANARLRELDRMKDEFVSLASHELRTPLTSIKYNLWMTLQGKAGNVTEKQKMYLERAYSSTTRLTKMVNDMLNISRIESNRIILNPFRSKLHTVAEDVIEEIRPHAKHLGVRLILVNYAVKPDSAEKVKLPDVIIDRDKIKEVLVNLIGNSLKFTPKDGQIRVWFEVDRDFVWVHITDSGIGFNPTKTRELFKKFGMIRESYVAYKDASQGTGLGLYICKSIISLHNGQIKAHSPGHNQGATFSFSVPIYSEQLKKHFAREFAGKTDAGIIMTQVMAE